MLCSVILVVQFHGISMLSYVLAGPDSQDADSDEEWPALGEAGAGEEAEANCGTEVVVDPEDEKAMQMFMNKNPPMRYSMRPQNSEPNH